MRHGNFRLSNFGDAINPILFEELMGVKPRWSAPRNADFAMIGSVFETLVRAGSRATVIGSGVRNNSTLTGAGRLDVRALRGTLSASHLGVDSVLAIGDPGLAIREVARKNRGVVRTGPLVIPHFAAANSRGPRMMIKSAGTHGARIIYPNECALTIAAEISQSPLVITSSLHAMVFADSLGVPVQRVLVGPKSDEPDFKYRDYESIFGLESTPITMKRWLGGTTSTLEMISALEDRSERVRSSIDAVITGIYAKFASVS